MWELFKGEVPCLLFKTKCDSLNDQDQSWRKNQKEALRIVEIARTVETKADGPDSKTEFPIGDIQWMCVRLCQDEHTKTS